MIETILPCMMKRRRCEMNEVASPKECVLVMQELDRITYLIKFGCLAKKSINEQTKFRLLRDEV